MTGEILAEEQHIRIKRCRHGLFMYNANDKYIGRSLDHYGEFSEGEAELFAQFLRAGMTMLDIGANIGVHTVTLARLAGAEGRVIAFEPQRVVYQMLCGNIALNALENVSAVMAALGEKAGALHVPPVDYRQTGNFGGIAMAASGRGDAVPVLTIDSLNLARCDFIKIDVEGMEPEVLRGAAATLARCRPILYVENDRWEKSQDLVAQLIMAGYRTYWHVPSLFSPANFFGERENVFPGLSSCNVIAIARELGTVMKNFKEVTPENAMNHPHRRR